MINIQEEFHTISLNDESNHIPYVAIKDLYHKLLGMDDHARTVAARLNALFTWSDLNSPWRKWVSSHAHKGVAGLRGKWTTRFGKYLKDAYGFDIDPHLLSIVGEYLSSHRTNNSTLHFEFAKYSDWRHGAFEGKMSPDGRPPGGCWWNEHSASRLGLVEDHRGWSILFYENEQEAKENSRVKGKGRCWMYVFEEGPVIFNAYGVSLVTIAAALSKLWGVPHTKIAIHSNEGLYINAGMRDNEGRGGGPTGFGFIFSDNVSVSEVNLPDIRKRDGICRDCGKGVVTSSCSKIQGGYVCEQCIESYQYCARCDELHRNMDTVRVDGKVRTICNLCLTKLDNCTVCGYTLYKTEKVWHTGISLCPTCIDNGEALRCDECRRLHLPQHMVTDVLFARRRIQLCRSDAKRLKERL